jgi:hypothetical protein
MTYVSRKLRDRKRLLFLLMATEEVISDAPGATTGGVTLFATLHLGFYSPGTYFSFSSVPFSFRLFSFRERSLLRVLEMAALAGSYI